MLHLIGALGAGGCTYKSVEFDGELVSGLSISERMTMANLAMEMGVKCVFTPTDDKAEAYLAERSSRPYEPIVADADAHYARRSMWTARPSYPWWRALTKSTT